MFMLWGKRGVRARFCTCPKITFKRRDSHLFVLQERKRSSSLLPPFRSPEQHFCLSLWYESTKSHMEREGDIKKEKRKKERTKTKTSIELTEG